MVIVNKVEKNERFLNMLNLYMKDGILKNQLSIDRSIISFLNCSEI